jgi:hypothetical protein
MVGMDGARGFCSAHYNEFRDHCRRNGSWSQKEQRLEEQRRFEGVDDSTPTVVRSKWEYKGREQELIDAQEQKSNGHGNGAK